MSRREKNGIGAALMLTVFGGTLTAVMFTSTRAPRGADPGLVAREILAEKMRVPPESINLTPPAYVSLPVTGKVFRRFKVVDVPSDGHTQVSVDLQGREVDGNALLKAEEAARIDRYGKMNAQLAESLTARSGERIPVAIWLDVPASDKIVVNKPEASSEDPTSVSAVEAVSVNVAAQDARRQSTARVRALMLPRILKLDAKATVNDSEPLIHATLTADDLNVVNTWSEVESIGEVAKSRAPQLNIVATAMQYVPTLHDVAGIRGAGQKLAQIEWKGLVVANANNFIDQVTQGSGSACDDTGGAFLGHATAIAGVMVSSHSTNRGVAPDAQLYAGGVCASGDVEKEAQATAAGVWGATAINLSYGGEINLGQPIADDHAKFFDSVWINNFHFVGAAAGDWGGPGCPRTNGDVLSPGTAYNVVTVGSINDKNTLDWGDNVMDPCSSWRDPTSPHGDRRKPEIVAPGYAINSSYVVSPWFLQWDGTSMSAPIATGTSALMTQTASSLTVWPELQKAILMATARQNVEGLQPFSDKDGAGTMNTLKAVSLAQGVNGAYSSLSLDCVASHYPISRNMSLTAGKSVRVVFVWDQNPMYASYQQQPSADLDIRVLNPSGGQVASSMSWDSNFEIVQFTAAVTGTYRLDILNSRCDLAPLYGGYAYHME